MLPELMARLRPALGLPDVSQREWMLHTLRTRGKMSGLQIVDAWKVDGYWGIWLPFGAVYPLLHRLERDGLIEGRWGETTEIRQGARRRYYRIRTES